jgi:Uma2 family endonuclease
VLELTADGVLSAMTTNGGKNSARNLRLGLRLLLWADGPGAGAWIAFDSSGGFRLPDGAVLCPDASLLRLERWWALTPEQHRGFPPMP